MYKNIKIHNTTTELIKEIKGNKKLSNDFIIWRALLYYQKNK